MKCKKKHHTSICDENQENTTQSASSQIKDDKGPKNDHLSADSVSKNRTHMGATHVLPSKAHILMQSAVTKISGNNKQYYQARILFDTGSQRTFITQEMKHKLKLGTMGSELLDVTTFGTLQGRRKTYDLVALTLSTEVENIKITALVTPVICPPLSAKVKNLQIPPELQGQNLFHEALQSLQMEIVTNVADDPDILNIIDITRYSTLVHLLRVTARVINFARKWRKRKVYSETFTAKDIVEARNVLLKATQHKIYRQEISYLKNKDKSRQPAITTTTRSLP